MEILLRLGGSRRTLIIGKRAIKFYPMLYGYLFHEFFRILFQIFNGIYKIDFVSRKKRIENEIHGRNILSSMGITTTKLVNFSLENYFLEEIFEHSYRDLKHIEMEDTLAGAKCARTIGKITRMLNDRGVFFIDNKSSNWLLKKDSIIRTDLELLRHENKNRDFYAMCDCVSFLSSVGNEHVRKGFMEGYGKEIRRSRLTEFLASVYIRVTDWIF